LNFQEYENALKTMKIGEISLFDFSGENSFAYKYLIITVENILYKMQFSKSFENVNVDTLIEELNLLNEICKNYIELAKNDKQYYKIADDLYSFCFNKLSVMPKMLREKMQIPENLHKYENMLKTLYLNKSLTSLKIQEYESVIKSADFILKIEHYNIKAMYRKGVAFYELKKLQDAYNLFKEVSKIEPENPALSEHKNFMDEFENSRKIKENERKSKYANFWEKIAKIEENEKEEKINNEKIERKEKFFL